MLWYFMSSSSCADQNPKAKQSGERPVPQRNKSLEELVHFSQNGHHYKVGSAVGRQRVDRRHCAEVVEKNIKEGGGIIEWERKQPDEVVVEFYYIILSHSFLYIFLLYYRYSTRIGIL